MTESDQLILTAAMVGLATGALAVFTGLALRGRVEFFLRFSGLAGAAAAGLSAACHFQHWRGMFWIIPIFVCVTLATWLEASPKRLARLK